jgi:hypothetical protein
MNDDKLIELMCERFDYACNDTAPMRYSELRKRMKAALRAVREWQPIETAPKDGTKFLGAYSGVNDVYAAYWFADVDSIYGGYFVKDGTIQVVKPTHWMPLPQPPQEGK